MSSGRAPSALQNALFGCLFTKQKIDDTLFFLKGAFPKLEFFDKYPFTRKVTLRKHLLRFSDLRFRPS